MHYYENKYKDLDSKELHEHVIRSSQSDNEDICEVAYCEKLHPSIEGDCPIHVMCIIEQDASMKTKLFFNLYYRGEHIGNPITLYFNICRPRYVISTDVDELKKIGEMMIAEFKSHCDLEDLNRELEGKCACKKFEGVYTSCDECPHYRFRKGGPGLERNESKDDCFGVSYNYPHHLNFWEIEKEIKEKYGPGSDNYKIYLKSRYVALTELMGDLIEDDPSFKKMFKKQLNKM